MMQDYSNPDLLILLLGKLIKCRDDVFSQPQDIRGILNRTLLLCLEALKIDKQLILKGGEESDTSIKE
jgi:hypothetical protein